jgi:two-component system cell cycle response regulator
VPQMLRRSGIRRLLPFLQGALLLDGAYLAWAMYATGGTTSPLRLLVYVHLVAITLLVSYRTGLKIALWDTLLYLVLFQVQAGALHPWVGPALGTVAAARFGFITLLPVAGFWMVAIATAAFSALNERALRSQKADLEQLSRMVALMDRSERPSDIALILLESLQETFGFPRAALLASVDGAPALLASVGAVGRAALPSGADPLMQLAWHDREVVLVRRLDGGTDERLARLFPDARNVLLAPLFLAGGRRLGILVCEHPKEDRIAGWIVAMVRQFAAHAALALHNAWLAEGARASLQQIGSLKDELEQHNLALELRVAQLETRS